MATTMWTLGIVTENSSVLSRADVVLVEQKEYLKKLSLVHYNKKEIDKTYLGLVTCLRLEPLPSN